MHKRSHGGERPNTGSLGKKILYALAAVVVLLGLIYFVATSSAFVKAVILPKVAQSIHGTITVEHAGVHPFSSINLSKLEVKGAATVPVITADEVHVRYSLMKILRGKIYVDEIALVNPVIQIVKEPDGSSNIDPLMKKGEAEPQKKKNKSEVRIENISLKNGTVRYSEKGKDGSSRSAEFKNLNVALDKLGNALSGTLKLDSDLALQESQGQTNSSLQGKVAGSYQITLDDELLPDVIKGETDLNISRAEGAFADAVGLKASLKADVTPTEVRQLALDLARNGQNLGQIHAQGPLDLNKKEGHVKLEIASLDRNVLEMATAGKNWKFGQSTINSTNQIDLSQNGEFVAAAGTLAGKKISITQNGSTTPELDLNLDYHANVNLAEKSAILQKLTLTGDSQGKPLVRGSLDRQMNLTWGQSLQGFREAAFTLGVTNLSLTDWHPLTPTNISSGLMNVTLALVAQQDGKILNIDLASEVKNLTINSGTNTLRDTQVALSAKGVLEQFTAANLNSFELLLKQNNERVLQANGAIRYDLKSKDLTGQTSADVLVPRFLAVYPLAEAKARSGTMKISASFTDSNGRQKASGNITIEDFAGNLKQYQFDKFQAGFDYNIEIVDRVLQIHRAAATVTQNYNTGGSLDIAGKFNLDKKSGQLSFKTVDLNENTFRPFLAPSLGENQLVSIALNTTGEATYDPAGESALKTEVKVTNWVVKDKEGKLPKTPLALTVNIDGSLKKELLDLRQFLVQLTPTPRAGNAFLLKGNLDLAKTNAQASTLTLSSEGLDVTTYYDLFAGESTNQAQAQKTSTPVPATAPATAPQGEQKEPEAMNLPVQNLTANLKFDRVYLRDIAISNWTGTVAIQSNMVAVKPFKLQLNGAPIDFSGNFNVGVPGYQYTIALSGDRIPLEPLANSFSADQNGQLKGDLFAQMNVSGSGVTGANLQKTLQGNAYFSATNMNYRILGPRLNRILVPIALVLRTPELTNTPINFVNVKTDMGGGKVTIQELIAQSEAFVAQSKGVVQLAAVLTNSPLNLPLELSLRRSLAEKARVLPPNTPPDAKYAKLPTFVDVRGTLGKPVPDIKETELLKMGIQTAANLGLGGKDLGKVAEGLGILQGQGDTNKTAGEKVEGLVSGIGSLLSKKANTNAPAANASNPPAQASTNSPPAQTNTNQPAPKQKINPLDLLKGLQRKNP
jgi:hypothetical protein